jgi:hypothetical protein
MKPAQRPESGRQSVVRQLVAAFCSITGASEHKDSDWVPRALNTEYYPDWKLPRRSDRWHRDPSRFEDKVRQIVYKRLFGPQSRPFMDVAAELQLPVEAVKNIFEREVELNLEANARVTPEPPSANQASSEPANREDERPRELQTEFVVYVGLTLR